VLAKSQPSMTAMYVPSTYTFQGSTCPTCMLVFYPEIVERMHRTSRYAMPICMLCQFVCYANLVAVVSPRYKSWLLTLTATIYSTLNVSTASRSACLSTSSCVTSWVQTPASIRPLIQWCEWQHSRGYRSRRRRRRACL